jgi:hypothetical protein
MLRSSLYTASVLLLSASALAQSNAASKVRPITSAPRDAGIYHVATGTWTRNASMANLGADRIYVNTCPTGYFSAFSGDTFIDEGRVPSPSSPQNLNSRPGCSASYVVDGFEVAYCVDTANVTWSWAFFDAYTPCATATGLTPVASFNLSGLPTVTQPGMLPACWIVQIDTSGPPPTVTTFTLQADGDGSFNTPPDTFGWSMRNSLAGAAGSGSGPLIAGDPNTCTGYDGTRWDNGAAPNWPNNLTEDGTGMGTADQFRIEGGVTTPGCYFFGGPPNPFGSFHLVLFSNACGTPSTGTPFCFGDGTGTPCPCGNNGQPGRGCANSIVAAGALLSATGNPSTTTDTVTLIGTGMPNASVLYFQGTTQQNGGLGSLFGDGLRCAGGVVVRLGTKVNVNNTSQYPTGSDLPVHTRGQVPAAGGTRTYQCWYRNAAAAFCPPAAFNLSNGLQIVWAP